MSIEFKNVSFSYPGKTIFSDFSFQFPDSGLCVILGRTGEGKTTLLSLISGQLKPQKGEITADRKDMSFVFQAPQLLGFLSVLDNIAFPLYLNGCKEDEAKDKALSLLEKLHLDYLKNAEVNHLSGGEKMRISLCRALIEEKKVIVLDECTGQLDEENTELILTMLSQLKENHLLILVTHDDKRAYDFADHLYTLKEGRLNELKRSECKVELLSKKRERRRGILKRKALKINGAFLKRKRGRFALSCLFFAFDLLLLELGIQFYKNSPLFLEKVIGQRYDFQTALISEKSEVYKGEHLAIEKKEHISKGVKDLLKIENTYVSLTTFLPETSEIECNGKMKTVNLAPVLKQDPRKIKRGKQAEKWNDIVVNSDFLNCFEIKEDEIGKEVNLSLDVIIHCKEAKSSDLLHLTYTFSIAGLSSETTFLNTPCIYYDYHAFYDYLSDIKLYNLSAEWNTEIRLSDLLKANSGEAFIPEEDLFFSPSILEIRANVKEYFDDVSLTSIPINTLDSFEETLSSYLTIVFVFLTLNALAAFFLEFLTISSLYDENMRMFALIYAFDFRKKTILKMVKALTDLFTVFTILPFFLSTAIFSIFLNLILEHFFLPSLFAFDFSSLFLLFLLSSLLSMAAGLLSLKRINPDNLKRELESEE